MLAGLVHAQRLRIRKVMYLSPLHLHSVRGWRNHALSEILCLLVGLAAQHWVPHCLVLLMLMLLLVQVLLKHLLLHCHIRQRISRRECCRDGCRHLRRVEIGRKAVVCDFHGFLGAAVAHRVPMWERQVDIVEVQEVEVLLRTARARRPGLLMVCVHDAVHFCQGPPVWQCCGFRGWKPRQLSRHCSGRVSRPGRLADNDTSQGESTTTGPIRDVEGWGGDGRAATGRVRGGAIAWCSTQSARREQRAQEVRGGGRRGSEGWRGRVVEKLAHSRGQICKVRGSW